MYTATSNRGNLIWDIYNKISQSLYFIGHRQKKMKIFFYYRLSKSAYVLLITFVPFSLQTAGGQMLSFLILLAIQKLLQRLLR